MGLSRKLGGSTSSRAEAPVHADYAWSTQAYTMRDILTKFRLPCVVQCSGDPGAVLWADFRFDMRQPLLLHAARTVRKIHARSLQIVDPSGDLEEFGPPLAIPEDYDGWFFPVGRTQDPGSAVPRHTRVEGAAGSPSPQFLVTTTLPAFAPATKGAASSGDGRHVKHEVTIGEVLTKVGVMKGDPSLAPSSPSALMQRSRNQSLRCLDENQHEVIIPFGHRALLFDVAEDYGAASNSGLVVGAGDNHPTGPSSPGVVHTQTIVTVGNKYLPRVFRHVLGELPALVQTFTGLMRCYSVFTEETVMAATMSRTSMYSMSQESSCLELATDSSAKFRIALNASDLKKTHQYAQALKTCEEQAPIYVRAIKTSFTVQPVVSELDEVDMSLYDGGKEQSQGIPEMDCAKSYTATQTSPVRPPDLKEGAFTGVMHLDRGGGTTDSNDFDHQETDDGVENESLTTDDVPNSVLDTASLSDATDIQCSDGISDVGDVEANSEFDFAWGQLKRAKSFSGSVSSLTDDSETSSTVTDSESEDSVVIHHGLDSSVSADSTMTRDTVSSASEDTVVLRTSAPSPVYANVSKKLSVYRSEQNADTSCDTEPSERPSTADRISAEIHTADLTLPDRSVRSVWNITPTTEVLHGQAQNLAGVDQDDGKDPIWWGDASDNISEPENTTVEYPSSFAQKPTAAKQSGVCVRSAVDGSTGLQFPMAPHSLQSSRLSVKSDGSTQDLAIQRLERALNDATNFLKSTHPQTTQPPLPPRRGKSDSVNIQQVGSISSYHSGQSQYDAQLSEAPCDAVAPSSSSHTDFSFQSDSVKGGTVMTHNYPSAPASKLSLSDPHRLTSADRQALYSEDHRARARIGSDWELERNSQRQTTQCQSDWHATGSDPAIQDQAPPPPEEGEVDADFVKALGDRLLQVSRKSSLPKYQRLQPDLYLFEDAEIEEGNHQFRKKKQRAGIVPRCMTQAGSAALTSDDGVEPCEYDSENAGVTRGWNYAGTSHNHAIVTDLDLLHEEVV
ncbi:hypothetical protein ACOMHN_017646 [Nucella lapillus]